MQLFDIDILFNMTPLYGLLTLMAVCGGRISLESYILGSNDRQN